MPQTLTAEIQRRIALDCDFVVTPSHDTIEFVFETTAKFNAVVNGENSIYDSITRAYMLGFTIYVFRDLEAEDAYSSGKDFWFRRPHRSGRSRWGAR